MSHRAHADKGCDDHGIDIKAELVVHLNDEGEQTVGQQRFEGRDGGEGIRQPKLGLDPTQGEVEREEDHNIGQDTDYRQCYQASSSLDDSDNQPCAQQKSALIGYRNEVPAQVSRQCAQKRSAREPNREAQAGNQNDLAKESRIRGNRDEPVCQCRPERSAPAE